MTVYNLGMTGHDFPLCASHLRGAIAWAKPTKYVIVEIYNLTPDDREVGLVLSDALPPKVGVIEGRRARAPVFIQRLDVQWRQSQNKGRSDDSTVASVSSAASTAKMLDWMGHIAGEHNLKLIVLFHQPLSIHRDGRLAPEIGPDIIQPFADACSAAGITFVNMTDVFLKACADHHVLPHGFANTRIGTGHLNAAGHRMVAEELARVIRTMEQQTLAAREAGNRSMGDRH
jgi:hypothetical protein